MNILQRILFCLSFLFTLNLGSLYAQNDFRPGYLLLQNSDSLFGQINLRDAVKNSESCSFRKNENAAIIIYLPGQIQAYRFTDGKYYISRSIPDSTGEKVVFLEYLMHGLADLFYYKTTEGERYYIQKQGGPFVELSNDAVSRYYSVNPTTNEREVSSKNDLLIGNTSGEYSRKSLKYLGVLNATFADCEKLRGKINRTEFNPRSLVKIAKEYHEYMCDSFQCLVYEKKIAPQLRFAPVLRLNCSNVSFNTTEGLEDKYHMYPRQFYTDLKHPMCFNYGLGVILDISSTRSNEKFSIQIESVITRSKFKIEGTEILAPRIYNHLVEISGTCSENCISVKYSYPKGNFRPTAFLGGNAIFAINTQGVRLTETIYNNSSTFRYYNDLPTNYNYLGFSTGAGIDLIVAGKKFAFIQIKLEKYFGEIIGSKPNSSVFAINTNVGVYL